MITINNPTLDNTPAYSGASTGVQYMKSTDPVSQIHSLVSFFESAGWTASTPTNSTATIVRIGLDVGYDHGSSSPPVRMPPNACTAVPFSSIGVYNAFAINGQTFVLYPQSSEVPPGSCTGYSNANIFVPMGTSQTQTANNIASAISTYTDFNAVFVGTSPPSWIVGAGFEFLLTSKIGIDADLEDIKLDGGTVNSSGGGYTLTSQTLNGSNLTVTLATNIHGAGTDSIIITVTASNGGSYSQEFYPGEYAMIGNPYQFVIYPYNSGTLLSGIGPNHLLIFPGFTTMILASMLWCDTNHMTTPNPVLVIGSNPFYFNDPQLQNQLYWLNVLATGLDTTLTATTLRTNAASVDFGPSVLFRGLHGAELDTLNGLPMSQAPYVALSNYPGWSTLSLSAVSVSGSSATYTYSSFGPDNLTVGQTVTIVGMTHPINNGKFVIGSLGPGTFTITNTKGTPLAETGSSGIVIGTSIIAGKLWDMIVVCGSAGNLGGKMLYDNRHWTQICSDSNLNDLLGTLWVLS